MFFKGVNFGFMAKRGYYGSAKAKEEVLRMKETGVNAVCVTVTVWQEKFYSSCQFRDFEWTPGDDELCSIIHFIHKQDMAVQLRPMLECFDGGMRDSIFFPHDGETIPGMKREYWKKWFDSYQKLTRYYAAIAQKCGCESYCMDSELNNAVLETECWKKTIAEAKKVYSGNVTCVLSNTPAIVDVFKYYLDDHWVCELDSLGLSVYPCVSVYPEDHPASVKEMISGMKRDTDEINLMMEKYPGICYFGECGCRSQARGSILPGSWAKGKGFDETEQANYLQAVTSVFGKNPRWHGLFWWKWEEQLDRPQYFDDPAGDKSFGIYGKKAAEIFKAWQIPEDHR